MFQRLHQVDATYPTAERDVSTPPVGAAALAAQTVAPSVPRAV